MGLTRYFPNLAALEEEPKPVAKPVKRTGKKPSKADLAAAKNATEEDKEHELRRAILTRLTHSMLEGSKLRGTIKGRPENDRPDDGLTLEQKNFEQEKLFREAREQYDQQQQQQQAIAETGAP